MQTVPSLVGTGAVVAAAAAGLVFGQPPESDTRPSSIARKPTVDYPDSSPVQYAPPRPSTSIAVRVPTQEEFPYGSFQQFRNLPPGPLSSQPPTSFVRRPRASTNQAAGGGRDGRKQSFSRQPTPVSRQFPEGRRDSISSRDSWIRRLSIRPLSQHESSVSSNGPASPSLAISHGSGVPFLSPVESTAPPLSPNKLVKRGTTTSGQDAALGGISRRGSKSGMPTFRRPATSHQRSATLQQQLQGQDASPAEPSRPVPELYIEQQKPARDASAQMQGILGVSEKQTSEGWTSFFHTKLWKSGSRAESGRSAEGNSNSSVLPAKKISLRGHIARVYLTKPNLIARQRQQSLLVPISSPADSRSSSRQDSREQSNGSTSVETTPSKSLRKSISMHFSSPSSWISKTGSIRRSKAKNEGQRDVSPPVTDVVLAAEEAAAAATAAAETEPTAAQEISSFSVEPQQLASSEAAPSLQNSTRPRNSSSPLPPSLHRLSSFSMEVAKLGVSGSLSPSPQNMTLNSAGDAMSGSHSSSSPFSHTRTVSRERASTFASFDSEARDGISVDDEDTDFKSDTVFDSFRTMASSNRVRTVETPLDSMFDESPPSTAGNSKTKRLSIQEILGRPWDGDTRIMEEDESLSTPVRNTPLDNGIEFNTQNLFAREPDSEASTRELSLINKDFARFSLDDDDDDDWARDDEDPLGNPLSNHLSPPGSFNARGISQPLRRALANISGNNGFDMYRDAVSERPRSNIFDWSEPPAHEKADASGNYRPKTVHGKREMDFRGGRPPNRKGPTATHVRSQSVPVVPDLADTSKPAPKFGTWGMGTKTASEDWDDDFDFGGEDQDSIYPVDGKDSATSFSMLVPASIQATQPTVKAHSGQIRELSLLVNDLKRLCRHGKDLDILNGPASSKWKEAENIIALASPDEEDAQEVPEIVEPSDDFDPATIDERFLDQGFDVSALEQPQDSWEPTEPDISKTAVIREKQAARRRSVFSPEDDIFGGNWPLTDENTKPDRPHTPDHLRNPNRDSAVIANVIEAMEQQRAVADPVRSQSPVKKSFDSKLFFDTNSLLELVKRAGHLRDSLSELVRRAELLTQSPAGTPRRERHARHNNPDGSPAFTRVFTDPASTPPNKHLPKSHSNNSVLSKSSLDSPRMQMMTVN